MMRLIVSVASTVCNVDMTRWPVSAAVSAVPIVSRSRISPTRMTSGSWRSALLRAWAKLWVSTPTSRWLMIERLSRIKNSIGSSIVMMCRVAFWLMCSIIAASVVDLPEPVVPVTSTRPRGSMAIFSITFGSVSCSMVWIRNGITRKTAPMVPRCWKTLTRKRPSPGTP